MNIAIIGAGNVGKALGASFVRAGHEVVIVAKDPAHAQAAASAVGAGSSGDVRSAAEQAQVIALAIPFVGAGAEVAEAIASVVAGKTVIDATNPLTPDYSGLATNGTSAAEEFQRWLPEAAVVKAFNTIFASQQADPDPGLEAFVAGDDADAKELVASLADSMGFTPLDVGALSTSRYLEGMAFLNIGLNAARGWDWTSSWKLDR